jgi:50S ribosomal protein L16 3-hydroxylase
LLVRGAFPDWQLPLQPEDLAGLACEELALGRLVVERPARRARDASRWQVRGGPFTDADFAALPPDHWSLLVQDVDKWDADVAALLAPFAFLPSWRVEDVMVSYAADGGSVGAHVDQYDVFLLQGLGQRRWDISTDPAAPREWRNDVELKLLRTFEPTDGWVLDPGDLLYLPPGVPHHGVAIGPCMTFSVGMRAPSQAELLLDLADTLAEGLPDAARLADPDLVPARNAGEIDAAALARVQRAMPWLRIAGATGANGGGIPPQRFADWFGSFITRWRSAQAAQPPPRALGDAALARALAAGAEVQRNPWSRVAWMRAAGGAALFVAGERHACSLALARCVGARPRFRLDVARSPRDRAVLRRLLDGGHFALVRTRRGPRP